MGELDENAARLAESSGGSSLNAIVAVAVSIFATLMALGNIKDGNIVQAMTAAQAKTVDAWSYYQAKGMKRHLAEAMADQLQIQLDTQPALAPAARERLDSRRQEYEKNAKRYEAEQTDIKKEAEALSTEYDRLNVHDDQFDMAEAAFSVAIALAGVAALTQKRWLLLLVFAFGAVGVLMETAGFFGWALHPDSLARFLG
jgi:Domain of unknown function (DUF4337)